MFDDVPSLPEILAEQIQPIIEGNQNVVNGLKDNYKKLEELYELKVKELLESQEEAKRAKKYNTVMLIIALVSAGIALASLVTTILIAVL